MMMDDSEVDIALSVSSILNEYSSPNQSICYGLPPVIECLTLLFVFYEFYGICILVDYRTISISLYHVACVFVHTLLCVFCFAMNEF